MKTLKTLYDVQQLLKKYGILVHVGKRKWDIELMAIELDNLYKAGILEKKVYLNAKLVLNHEHEYEKKLEKENRLD
ncbi:YqgQ family protein [Lactobacillus sp.]|uniref:YqgQ family protein n=1 Tax=Lactobacillus sp. TaxID=1591 RepID=UPI003EF3BDCA